MVRVVGWVAASAGLWLGACSAPPNLIVARDPIPPPPPGYQVLCRTSPGLFWTQHANCIAAGGVILKERIVRVRG
jgi:hypothetical protein